MRLAIPAKCVQPNTLDYPRGDRRPIDFSKLRQDAPPVYQLGARDVLGGFQSDLTTRRSEIVA